MVTCPNCGSSVASTQRYCGNCGTDVQAAMAARGAPVSDTQPSPYAYAQPTYDYAPTYSEPSRAPMRLILIAGVVLLVACCAFACGLLIGFELIPDVLGLTGGAATPRPTPRFTPTPQGMILWFI